MLTAKYAPIDIKCQWSGISPVLFQSVIIEHGKQRWTETGHGGRVFGVVKKKYLTPSVLKLKVKSSLISGSLHFYIHWLKCVGDFQIYTKNYKSPTSTSLCFLSSSSTTNALFQMKAFPNWRKSLRFFFPRKSQIPVRGREWPGTFCTY